MSVHCFCNKIKTFLNLSVKINIPASVSRKEAVQFELSTSFFDVKKTKTLPRRALPPSGLQRPPWLFSTHLAPESHRIIQKGNTP